MTDTDIYCERVDEQIFFGSMLERIYSQISKADLLVADMTGKNPNVFYEVGYAHALGKNVVLLTSVANDIPFDLRHFPHIIYGNEIKTLRSSLGKHLKYLASKSPDRIDTQIGFELFLKGARLADGNVTIEYEKNRGPQAVLTLSNNSTITYAPGEFRVAVITPSQFDYSQMNEVVVTALPDGTYMHMLPMLDTLFPGAYTTVWFRVDSFNPKNEPPDFTVNIRIFSSAGLRDFPLDFRCTVP